MNLKNEFKHLIKYGVIGCSGAGLDFLLYSLLVLLTPWHYQWINLLSTSCGILNNFFLNALLNFKTKDHLLLRLCSFYTVGLIGIGITATLLFLLIECFSINAVIAKIITIFVVTAVQFILNRFVTFKTK